MKECDRKEIRARVTPLFKRNATEKCNTGVHKARRLNKSIVQKIDNGPSTYFVLCSWSLRGRKDGKEKIKRKGPRQMQWCGTCRQTICGVCWNEWHTTSTLKRAKPIAADAKAFE